MHARTALLGLITTLTLSPLTLAEHQMRVTDEDNGLYSVSFEGGGLDEFIDMVREGVDGRAMLITPERAAEIKLPAFELKNVEYPQVLSLCERLTSVPTQLVTSQDWGAPFESGAGVPIIVFLAEMVLPEASPSPAISTLEFGGGSLVQYIDLLKRSGARGKVVLTGESVDVPVQQLSLSNVSLEAAVYMLDGMEGMTGDAAWRVGVEEFDNLYRVEVQSSRRGVNSASRVWSLREMTAQGMNAQTLLGAIEVGLETLGSKQQPNLRFHEPTGLLIAVGDTASMQLIEAVISGLGRSAIIDANMMDPLSRMRQYRGALKREIERLAASADDRQARMESIAIEIDELTRRIRALDEAGEARQAAQTIARVNALTDQQASGMNDLDVLSVRWSNIEVLMAQLDALIKGVEEGELAPLDESILSREFSVSRGLGSTLSLNAAPAVSTPGSRRSSIGTGSGSGPGTSAPSNGGGRGR